MLLNVPRNNTNTFFDHSRTIINFHKSGNIGIIDLDIDIKVQNKTGESYDAETIIFVVAYGVKGHQNDVDFRIWSRAYYIENKVVNYETAINMNNHQIKGLSVGNEDNDVVNVKQLNELETNVTDYVKSEIENIRTEISKENPIINNNKRLINLILDYILKNEGKITLIKELYFSDSRGSRLSNSYGFLISNENRGYFTFYYVFQHSLSTNDVMRIEIIYRYTSAKNYFFVSKNKLVISQSSLINEPSLKSIDIPKNALVKQVWFWIWVKDRKIINFIFSGINDSNVKVSDYDVTYDKLNFIRVDDTPFT